MRVARRKERVGQQSAFSCSCATANQLLAHFPTLNTSLPGETVPGKMQLPFFSSFAAVRAKRNTDENVVLNHTVETFKTSENQTNIHVL